MKLDHQYVDRSESVERDLRAGIGIYGYAGHQEMPEGDDFRDILKSRGATYTERTIDTIETWEDTAELHYQREGQERYAYVLNFRSDIDVWSQSVYIFVHPVPDDQLADTILTIRRQEKDLDQLVYERCREIDKEYPAHWRLINYNGEMSILAYHLIRQGWTPQVESVLKQWGAYNTHSEGVGMENLLVRSLLFYGKLIMAQPDPNQYTQGVLKSMGTAARRYQKLL